MVQDIQGIPLWMKIMVVLMAMGPHFGVRGIIITRGDTRKNTVAGASMAMVLIMVTDVMLVYLQSAAPGAGMEGITAKPFTLDLNACVVLAWFQCC